MLNSVRQSIQTDLEYLNDKLNNSKNSETNPVWDNFEKISQCFKNCFAELKKNGLPTIKKQVELAWLYFNFSFYVTETNAKNSFATIKELDTLAYPIMGEILKNCSIAKNFPLRSGENNARAEFHCFCQRLLHLQGNLFAFTHRLHLNGNTISAIITKLPLQLPKDVLAIIKNEAMHRTVSGASQIELSINQYLSEKLKNAPEPFKPLKGKHGEIHIEPTTGLELDFPLKEKMTLETDGPNHFYSNGSPQALDIFKGAIMREAGWTRVSINVMKYKDHELEGFTSNIVQKLHMPQVVNHHASYQKLMELRKKIQAKIIEIPRGEQYLPVLENLFRIEQEIRMLAHGRHLERTLLDDQATSKRMLRTAANVVANEKLLLNTIKMTKEDIEKYADELSVMKGELVTLKSQRIKVEEQLRTDINDQQIVDQKITKHSIPTGSEVNEKMRLPYLSSCKKQAAELKLKIAEHTKKLQFLEEAINKLEGPNGTIEIKGLLLKNVTRQLAEGQLKLIPIEIMDYFNQTLPTSMLNIAADKIEQSYNELLNEIRNISTLALQQHRSFLPNYSKRGAEGAGFLTSSDFIPPFRPEYSQPHSPEHKRFIAQSDPYVRGAKRAKPEERCTDNRSSFNHLRRIDQENEPKRSEFSFH